MPTASAPPVRPPQAPAFRPHICLDQAEKIGIPLLLLLPVLGLCGVFDEQVASVTAPSRDFTLQVTYPSRTRHHLDTAVEIEVHNTTGRALPRVTLAVDRHYLAAFDQLRFLPEPTRQEADAFEIDFSNLQAGEIRRLKIELRPDRPWLHRARISAHTPDGARAEARLSSLIFP